MWTSASVTCTIVWDEVLWHAAATWVDDDASPPVTMVKSGRAPLGDGDGPDEALAAAVRALQGLALEPAGE
jgi:hypothetical protein